MLTSFRLSARTWCRGFLFSGICLFSLQAKAALLEEASMEQAFPELVELYDRALESGRISGMQLSTFRQARQSERIARANLYPRANVGVNIGATQFRPQGEPDSTSFGLNFNLALSQSLYQWGALRARREMGRINRDITHLNEQQRLQDLAQTIRTFFSHLVLDRVQMQIDAIDEYIQRQNMDFQRREFESGRLSANDYESRVLQHRQTLLGIAQRASQFEERLASLNRFLGLEDVTFDDIPEVYPEIPNLADIKAAMQQTLASFSMEDHLAVRRLYLQSEFQSQRNIEARSFQRPHLSIFSSLGQGRTNTSRQDNVSQIILFAGLSVNWNIFDGFAAQAERRLRLEQSRMLEYQIWDQFKSLEIDNQRLLQQVAFSIDRLETAERQFRLERLRFEDSIRQAEEGRLSDLDFAGVQMSLLRQEYTLYGERRQFQLVWGDFLKQVSQDPAFAQFDRVRTQFLP